MIVFFEQYNRHPKKNSAKFKNNIRSNDKMNLLNANVTFNNNNKKTTH